jgi:hypothetical protein
MIFTNPIKIKDKTYELTNDTDYRFGNDLRVDGPYIRVWTKRPTMAGVLWLINNGFRPPTKSALYYDCQPITSLNLMEPLNVLRAPTMFSWGGYSLIFADQLYVHDNDHDRGIMYHALFG